MIKFYNGNKFLKKKNSKKIKIWLQNGSKTIKMVTKQYSTFVLFQTSK